MSNRTATLGAARTWVVKIGSALLTGDGQGVDVGGLDDWCRQIAALAAQGRRVVLVSSGAIAEGCRRLGFAARPTTVHDLQAAAAVGQAGLIEGLRTRPATLRPALRIGAAHPRRSGEPPALSERPRHADHAAWISASCPWSTKNDSVATDEIKLGDNDTLAGMVASLLAADVLVLLTDRDGLHEADPRLRADAPLVREAAADDARLDRMAGAGTGRLGRGGMVTKLAAARMAALSGTNTLIANGRSPDILTRLARGDDAGTLLTATLAPCWWMRANAGSPASCAPRATCGWDAGAAAAIVHRGVSILPAGVVDANGAFRRGDMVRVLAPDDGEIAKGLANYDIGETRRILGRKSDQIEAILGYVDEQELVHRDNLVVLGGYAP